MGSRTGGWQHNEECKETTKRKGGRGIEGTGSSIEGCRKKGRDEEKGRGMEKKNTAMGAGQRWRMKTKWEREQYTRTERRGAGKKKMQHANDRRPGLGQGGPWTHKRVNREPRAQNSLQLSLSAAGRV